MQVLYCANHLEEVLGSLVVDSIVGYPVDVESTYLSTDGILAGAKEQAQL